MSERIDCVVIGAGVVGLAIGRALASSGREVAILERNGNFGEETSSRNSEVIHAGIYYPAGSLKARLCLTGKRQLYTYCEQKQVAVGRCGKLIVTTDESQHARLETIADHARRNGVADLQALNAKDIAAREPAVRATAGLWSPSTGIIDAHGLMLALLGDFESDDGILATHSRVQSIEVTAEDIRLALVADGDSTEIITTTAINAAGLGAAELAAKSSGCGDYSAPEIHLAKGNYFAYRAQHPFTSLIYPLPEDGGLGVHATLDLAGKLRFGPDVEWIDAIDYSVDPERSSSFAESIRRYWPDVDEDLLAPSYAGIRPKLSGPGAAAADFRIDVAAGGSARQLIHLLGIESPGLTSALALATAVCDELARTSR